MSKFIHTTPIRVFIERFVLGELAANCYVLWRQDSSTAVIIDPGDGEVVSAFLAQHQLTLQAVLLTHGHFDHALGLFEILLNFPAPVYMHPRDNSLLAKAHNSAGHWLGHQVDPIPTETEDLVHIPQQVITDFGLRILQTPGHTPGSCCIQTMPKQGTESGDKITYFFEQQEYSDITIILTGDTLFMDGIGDTSHQYSRISDLHDSLHTLAALAPEALLLPGHGEHGWLSDSPAGPYRPRTQQDLAS